MAAAAGNQYAAKAKMVEQALKRAAEREDWKRFHDGIEKVWDAWAAGEMWAVHFVRDTIDGKPKERVEIDATPAYVEAVSGLAAFVAKAIGEGTVVDHAGVGEVGSVLPDSLPPTAH